MRLRSVVALRGRYHSDTVLAFRPSPGDIQKHTFALSYFSSSECKEQAKVVHKGAGTLRPAGSGQFGVVATRDLHQGEVIERGILRSAGNSQSAFLLREGCDFMPIIPSSCPNYLSSGLAMFYPRADTDFNTELALCPDAQPGAVEFEIRCVKDIPQGAALVRRAWEMPAGLSRPDIRYADVHSMSDEDVNKYLDFRLKLDKELAREAGIEPEELHEDVIREHARLTREGILAPVGGDGGGPSSSIVVLPHPSWSGYGAFATRTIRSGEVVEWGLQIKVDGLDGLSCPYVFTWNPDGRRRKTGNVWTTGSGSSMFYNSDLPPNTRLYRLFSAFRYVIVATRDIQVGEELVHLYASSSWRTCFVQDSCLPKLLPIKDFE